MCASVGAGFNTEPHAALVGPRRLAGDLWLGHVNGRVARKIQRRLRGVQRGRGVPAHCEGVPEGIPPPHR